MKKYLKEDKDIIEQIDSLGGQSLDADFLLSKLQIKSMLRNRKSLEDSGKQSARFSVILLIFALVQFTVMLFQLIISILDSKNIWVGIILMVVMFFMIMKIFKDADKITEKL